MTTDELWFVTCVANPCGYQSRYNLYNDFVDHVLTDLQANLLTVECAFDEEPYRLPERAGTKIVRVRSRSRLWNKENLLNIGISHLPPEANMVCWCDADIVFIRGKDVKRDIIIGLQKYDVVQCFSSALDMGPSGDVMKTHHGFGFCHVNKICHDTKAAENETFFHSGYVYAARRVFLQSIGGLFEWGIVGSGDRLMAMSCIGQVRHCLSEDLSKEYRDAVLNWQTRVSDRLNNGLGYCAGVIKHSFHGHKRDRGYNSRSQILKKHSFVPERDLIKNRHGVLEFTDTKPELQRDVLQYFHSRKEDVAMS